MSQDVKTIHYSFGERFGDNALLWDNLVTSGPGGEARDQVEMKISLLTLLGSVFSQHVPGCAYWEKSCLHTGMMLRDCRGRVKI